MGIYTSAGFSGSSVDIYSPAEKELCCEGFDINFYEASMVAVAESEAVYNNSMKEVGIAELRYFEENGQEIIYEAVDIRAFFNKIKMFFKKLLDKVKAIFHTFIAKLSSFVQSDKDFVRKYEKEFSRKWNDVKEDFEFKGYKFTINDSTTVSTTTPTDNEVEALFIKEIEVDDPNAPGNKKKESKNLTEEILNFRTLEVEDVDDEKDDKLTKFHVKYLNNLNSELREKAEDIREGLRGSVLADTSRNFCTISGYSVDKDAKFDAKDFSEELFKIFRNNETSKESIEKKDFNVIEITSELRSAEKTKKTAEKATKYMTNLIDKAIKKIEKWEKELLREIPNKTKTSDIKTNFTSACLTYLNILSGQYKDHREYAVQAGGAVLQALKDRSRQNKAIMVKVISGSKKMQRESYDYTNESYDGSGSFLDSVVLK